MWLTSRGIAAALLASTILATTGCKTTDMSKQEAGTAIGLLGGAAIGSMFGDGAGRAAAVAAGAVIGGVLGNVIGAHLDEQDAAAVTHTSADALENADDGETITWSNPETNVKAELTPVETRAEKRNMKIARLKTVEAPGEMILIGRPYEVTGSSVNVRTGPGLDRPVNTTVQRGDVLTAVGKVTGAEDAWIMVAREGRSFGYVHGSLLAPASDEAIARAKQQRARDEAPQIATAKAEPATPAPAMEQAPAEQPQERQVAAVDLDAVEPTLRQAEAVNLDEVFAEDEDVVVEEMAVTTECREMRANIQTAEEASEDTFTACKAPDGAWEIG